MSTGPVTLQGIISWFPAGPRQHPKRRTGQLGVHCPGNQDFAEPGTSGYQRSEVTAPADGILEVLGVLDPRAGAGPVPGVDDRMRVNLSQFCHVR